VRRPLRCSCTPAAAAATPPDGVSPRGVPVSDAGAANGPPPGRVGAQRGCHRSTDPGTVDDGRQSSLGRRRGRRPRAHSPCACTTPPCCTSGAAAKDARPTTVPHLPRTARRLASSRRVARPPAPCLCCPLRAYSGAILGAGRGRPRRGPRGWGGGGSATLPGRPLAQAARSRRNPRFSGWLRQGPARRSRRLAFAPNGFDTPLQKKFRVGDRCARTAIHRGAWGVGCPPLKATRGRRKGENVRIYPVGRTPNGDSTRQRPGNCDSSADQTGRRRLVATTTTAVRRLGAAGREAADPTQ